ncbi:MAG: EF-P lysine aminoacylase GenX [Gammaproteobacteria bacterium RIFCSPHIGHO2_12_FULL_42_13]|nr:MAG: EF-P lysine aminoacylase GenX [Gammaproteobacteria bacterium RIFCSPHIGHO2_12_FULL_42_13]
MSICAEAHQNKLKIALQARALLYQKIRAFFAERQVLEVETPLLCQHTVTDPHIESFTVPTSNQSYFLQTSPEYAMKRLLSQGSGSIYQICKAFRREEAGQQHNPEFTMLEWYRLGFDHHALMNEVDALLQYCFNTPPAEKISYQAVFQQYLSLDSFAVSLEALKKIMLEKIAITEHDLASINKDTALQLLLSHCIEPHFGVEKPLFLYDFPPSQAALAKINHGVAERFELYLQGSEIANGFHELADAAEQEARFKKNQVARANNGYTVPKIDYYFINALKKGLPACAGVAIGLDRLLMFQLSTKNIADVLPFPFHYA